MWTRNDSAARFEHSSNLVCFYRRSVAGDNRRDHVFPHFRHSKRPDQTQPHRHCVFFFYCFVTSPIRANVVPRSTLCFVVRRNRVWKRRQRLVACAYLLTSLLTLDRIVSQDESDRFSPSLPKAIITSLVKKIGLTPRRHGHYCCSARRGFVGSSWISLFSNTSPLRPHACVDRQIKNIISRVDHRCYIYIYTVTVLSVRKIGPFAHLKIYQKRT